MSQTILLSGGENSYSRQNAGVRAFLQRCSLFMCAKVLSETGSRLSSARLMEQRSAINQKGEQRPDTGYLKPRDHGCSTCRCHTCPGFYCAPWGQGSTALVRPHYCSPPSDRFDWWMPLFTFHLVFLIERLQYFQNLAKTSMCCHRNITPPPPHPHQSGFVLF